MKGGALVLLLQLLIVCVDAAAVGVVVVDCLKFLKPSCQYGDLSVKIRMQEDAVVEALVVDDALCYDSESEGAMERLPQTLCESMAFFVSAAESLY